jgi:uncharacterized protein YdhG (YjbR/CyaY superfamily)
MSPTKQNTPPIDKYISRFPKETKIILENIRRTIKTIIPNAEESISYGIPTFDLNGKHLVHFAAYKKHIGFYPTSSGISAFRKELSEFESARGSVRFPLDKPIPLGLIRKIVRFRVKENKSFS